MKKSIVALSATVCFAIGGGTALADHVPGHHHGPISTVESDHADVNTHHACSHCGMDREKFSHSRMLATYADGTTVGTCSIHCMVTELKASKSKVVKSIEVGDFATRKLVDAEKAFWVIGGDKKGVMTRNPKWAFAKKETAEAFVRTHGGKLATYKEALDLAGKL